MIPNENSSCILVDNGQIQTILQRLSITTVTLYTQLTYFIFEKDITKGCEVERDVFRGLSTGFIQCTRPRQLLASPFARRHYCRREHCGPLFVQQKACEKG